MKHRHTGRIKIGVALALFGATTAFADTDVYGNEIRRDANGNITYQFWYGGETAEAMSTANSASAGSPTASFATGTLSARTVETSLEARFRTWLASIGTKLNSTKWMGFFLIVK